MANNKYVICSDTASSNRLCLKTEVTRVTRLASKIKSYGYQASPGKCFSCAINTSAFNQHRMALRVIKTKVLSANENDDVQVPSVKNKAKN